MRDAAAYICKHYPYKSDLSNARVTKMIYLADWRSAIRRGKQLTDTEWVFDRYGPFVYAILDIAREDPDFEVVTTRNMYGSPKDLLKVADDVSYPSLEEEEKEILDFVIESTQKKNFEDFIRLVYSTYPVTTQERHSKLDLVGLAQEYEEIMPLLQSDE